MLSKWFKNEPVMVAHAVAAVLGWLATFAVLHGVVSNTVASATVQEIAPTVVLVAMTGIGIVVRNAVIPAERWVEAEAEKYVARFAPGMAPAVEHDFASLDAALATITTNPWPQAPSTPARGSLVTPGATNAAGGTTGTPSPVLTPEISGVSDTVLLPVVSV